MAFEFGKIPTITTTMREAMLLEEQGAVRCVPPQLWSDPAVIGAVTETDDILDALKGAHIEGVVTKRGPDAFESAPTPVERLRDILTGEEIEAPLTVDADALDSFTPVRVPLENPNLRELKAGYANPNAGTVVKNLVATVTGIARDGIFIANSTGGIFVYTQKNPRELFPDLKDGTEGSAPSQVSVTGLFTTFRGFDESSANNLASPQIVARNPGDIQLTGQTGAKQEPLTLGETGLALARHIVSPATAKIMKELETDDLEAEGVPFDPVNDGAAQRLSLEGELVRIPDAIVTQPSDDRGFFSVMIDGGQNVPTRNLNGGAVRNPAHEVDIETQIFSVNMFGLPAEARPKGLKVGDRIPGGLIGHLTKNRFGEHEIRLSEAPETIERRPIERTPAPKPTGPNQIILGIFNMLNVSPDDEHVGRVAAQAFEAGFAAFVGLEGQDNSGTKDDGVVDADQTVAAIADAYGKLGKQKLSAVWINPVNNQDGGEPGGNIRQIHFFREDLVTVREYGNAGPTDSAKWVVRDGRVELNKNSVRIEADDPIYQGSRKPLATRLTVVVDGEETDITIDIAGVHQMSKRGDMGPWGRRQPPKSESDVKRAKQAAPTNAFMEEGIRLTREHEKREAISLIAGDANAHPDEHSMEVLAGSEFVNIISLLKLGAETLSSHRFRGVGAVLDNILASKGAAQIIVGGGYLQWNSDLPEGEATSDHNLVYVILDLNALVLDWIARGKPRRPNPQAA